MAWNDPIVEEVEEAAKKIAANFGYNLEEYITYLIERQTKSGHELVTKETLKTIIINEPKVDYSGKR